MEDMPAGKVALPAFSTAAFRVKEPKKGRPTYQEECGVELWNRNGEESGVASIRVLFLIPVTKPIFKSNPRINQTCWKIIRVAPKSL